MVKKIKLLYASKLYKKLAGAIYNKWTLLILKGAKHYWCSSKTIAKFLLP